jgi:hypothetical protein
MSRLTLSALSLLLLFAASTNAYASPEPVRVGATFAKIYIPEGFDSNDQVQIVGEGMFRNTCYRPAPGAVKVDDITKTILVGPVAYEYSGFCLQVILPFNRVVDVGMLKPGTWKVVQRAGATVQPLGEINITTALTNAPDDYIYAPVSQAFFQQDGLMSNVFLTGEFRSSCMTLDTVKISIQKDVVVLQPIAKVSGDPGCKDGTFAFSKKVDLGFVPQGRYLLHVRSMNGNAVNTLISVN